MKDIEQKIQSVLDDIKFTLFSAIGPRDRKKYMKSKGISKDNIDWHFGLSGKQILKEKIPTEVIGCTGRAKLFYELLKKKTKDKKFESFVVCTAKYSDWCNAKNGKSKHMDGHQIMAVKIGNRFYAFDPGRKTLSFVSGKIVPGEIIDAVGNGEKYIISAIIPSAKFAKVDTYQKLHNLYASGNMDNPKFTIVPKTATLFRRAINNIHEKLSQLFAKKREF